MFYVPLELQAEKLNNHAQGPNFKRAKVKRITIDGTKICIRLPRNRVGWRRHTPELWEARPHYITEASPKYAAAAPSDRLYLPTSTRENDDWRSKTIMAREWDFYGAWFTGRLATLRLYITVTQAKTPQGTSYFHPRVFETALMDKLARQYDTEHVGDNRIWQVPLCWQQKAGIPCPAATFMAEPDNRFRARFDNEYSLAFPIHDDYLVLIDLITIRIPVWRNRQMEEIEKWTPIAPLEAYAKQVLDTVTLELSPEATEQMQRAHAGLNDTSLVKHFAPINIEEYKKNKLAMKKGKTVNTEQKKSLR
jgi:hypothetical protein